MQEDPTTDHTDRRPIGLDLDRDDWESSLKPYKGDPHAALLLGFNLAVLRTNLDSQLIKCRPVMEALHHGMENNCSFRRGCIQVAASDRQRSLVAEFVLSPNRAVE